MMIGTQEHYDLMAAFERDHRGCRLDREAKDLWPKGNVYQNGETNALFLAYRNGAAFAKAYHRDDTPARPAQGASELADRFIESMMPPLSEREAYVAKMAVGYVTAARGAGGLAVAVKALDWRQVIVGKWWVAEGLGLKYEIDATAIGTFIATGSGAPPQLTLKSAQSVHQADYERRILSALSHPPAQQGWRKMESAPREHGHMILAANRYGTVDTVCWSDAANDGKGGWDDGFYGDDLPPYDPAIWMPVPLLPAAPLSNAEPTEKGGEANG